MYAFIEGTVCEKTNGCLVLQAGGVGWQLSCSNNTLMAAPALGETMRCFTFLSVREDALELFGFATREEKEMFLQLTSVSGIGPKTALGVLGAMPLRDLNLAILLGERPVPGSRHRQEDRPAHRAGAQGQSIPGGCFRRCRRIGRRRSRRLHGRGLRGRGD